MKKGPVPLYERRGALLLPLVRNILIDLLCCLLIKICPRRAGISEKCAPVRPKQTLSVLVYNSV